MGPDVVIWGITIDGRPFRPSDWPERLAGLTSAFGQDQRLAYSPLVQPVTVRGTKCVVVGGALLALEPRFHQFLLQFARDNDLDVTRHEDALAAPQTLTPPAIRPSITGEPREPV
jgi:hypothetical protein